MQFLTSAVLSFGKYHKKVPLRCILWVIIRPCGKEKAAQIKAPDFAMECKTSNTRILNVCAALSTKAKDHMKGSKLQYLEFVPTVMLHTDYIFSNEHHVGSQGGCTALKPVGNFGGMGVNRFWYRKRTL